MAHGSDVDDMTHDKTRHDNVGKFVLLLVCMSSYSLLGDGCPHGVSHLHLHMTRCIESSMFVGFT